MVYVDFLGPISRDRMEIEGVDSLKGVADTLKKDESLKEWLPTSAVAINDRLCNNIFEEVKQGDVISILPPVCGG